MEIEPRTYARIGHILPNHLLEIGLDSFAHFKRKLPELKKLQEKGFGEFNGMKFYIKQDEINTLEDALLKDTIKVIIFFHSFLESYFFDLAAVTLGQQYSEKYLDKLDLISKIVIIPKIAFNCELDRSLSLWEGIKKLIKWRNKIIHNKTKDAISVLQSEVPNKELYEEADLNLIYKSLINLFKELDKLDPEGYHLIKLKL